MGKSTRPWPQNVHWIYINEMNDAHHEPISDEKGKKNDMNKTHRELYKIKKDKYYVKVCVLISMNVKNTICCWCCLLMWNFFTTHSNTRTYIKLLRKDKYYVKVCVWMSRNLKNIICYPYFVYLCEIFSCQCESMPDDDGLQQRTDTNLVSNISH